MSAVASAGNGAARLVEERRRASRGVADHGRQVRHDAEALVASVRDATNGVQRYLSAQVEERPLGTLGVAAALGYLLGGGLGSRLTVVLLGAATRLATALVARELGGRIMPTGALQFTTGAPEDNSGAAKEQV